MANLTQDLRYAIRSLVKSPVLLVAATLSLGLGIGGNATIFTAVNGLLLKPLPVVDPSRTVAVYTGDYSGPPYSSSSYPDYVAFRERLTTLDRLAAMSLHPTSLTTPSGTDRVFLGMVSADFFRMAQPLALGRGFSAAEDQPPAGEPVIVLSHGLWLRRFGGDSTVIGRSVVLGGHPFTVIGVGQTGFTGLVRGFGQDAWVPLTLRRCSSPDPTISPTAVTAACSCTVTSLQVRRWSRRKRRLPPSRRSCTASFPTIGATSRARVDRSPCCRSLGFGSSSPHSGIPSSG